MGRKLFGRRRWRTSYWVVESRATTLHVQPDPVDGSITLTIHGPLEATALRPDGVGRHVLPELRLRRLRFAGGDGVTERLHRWAVDMHDVEVSLGCLIDHRGTVHAPTLSGVIADLQGNDIVFGDADPLASR